jgi:hypothetical protein
MALVREAIATVLDRFVCASFPAQRRVRVKILLARYTRRGEYLHARPGARASRR